MGEDEECVWGAGCLPGSRSCGVAHIKLTKERLLIDGACIILMTSNLSPSFPPQAWWCAT